MNIPGDMKQILIRIDKLRLKPPLKNRSYAFIFLVEIHSIRCVKSMYKSVDRYVSILTDK